MPLIQSLTVTADGYTIVGSDGVARSTRFDTVPVDKDTPEKVQAHLNAALDQHAKETNTANYVCKVLSLSPLKVVVGAANGSVPLAKIIPVKGAADVVGVPVDPALGG